MSNIQPGKVIYSNDDGDYRLVSHSDGHVRSWNRNYFDGQPLPTWRSCDHGTPEEAAEVYPGLASEIEAASKGA